MKTGKKMATGLWPSLEALATPAAVLAEWQMLTGDEFDRVRPYLCETDRQSDTFPCSNRPRCGCRHEIVDLDDGRIIAPCRCDHEQCTTLKLAPGDVVVHELDTASLCAALCETLELESVPPGKFDAAPRCHRVGTRGDAQTTVVLALATGEPALLAECGGLCAAIPNPFILLTPTGASFTPKIEAAVRRHQSIHIPLARHLALNGKSLSRAGEKVARGRKRCPAFTILRPIKPVLDAFERALSGPSPLHPLRAGERAGVRCPDDSQLSIKNSQRAPRYSLRKGGGYWTLTFNGQEAPVKHEKGILYVAWLLAHPDAEPIHAIDLAAQVPAIYRRQLGITAAVDQKTGKSVAFDKGARPQERSLALDDLDTSRALLKKQQELEAVLDDDDATEPEKAEALKMLEQIYAFQKSSAMRSKSSADNVVRAVRLAINRFHQHLAAATDRDGQPHPVLRAFADHLAKHLITPSSRFNGRMGARTRAGVAGRFTYEPPEGIAWPQ